MKHRPDKLRLARFYKYIQRVFSFQQQVRKLNDHRIAADVPTEALFEVLFCGLLLRLGSFRSLEFEHKQGRIKKVAKHRHDFSINTLRYGLAHFEHDSLVEMLCSMTRKTKRAKMLCDTIGGLHVAAVDGTEYSRSSAINCPACMTVHLPNGEVQYVHRCVLMQHVGGQLKPFVAAEPILPKDITPTDSDPGHEGELTAAKRLLTRAVDDYGKRFIDLLTCDALYMNRPFVQHCQSLGFDLIARVKNERTTLYQEIVALADHVESLKGYDAKAGIAYTIQRVTHLEVVLDWEIPVHGFRITETRSSGDTQTFLAATTRIDIDSNLMRRIVHQKWG